LHFLQADDYVIAIWLVNYAGAPLQLSAGYRIYNLQRDTQKSGREGYQHN